MFIYSYATHDGDTEYVAAFSIRAKTHQEMTKWCHQTFGAPGYLVDTHEIRWVDQIKYGEVRFRRKSDAEFFILRWSL